MYSSGVGAARLGGGKGERTERGDVGASGDALSGVAVCAIHNYYYYYYLPGTVRTSYCSRTQAGGEGGSDANGATHTERTATSTV